jgi:hypothetical protein
MESDNRRRGQAVWSMPDKVYVPCPPKVKAEFAAAARNHRATQAELGLALVIGALENPALMRLAMMRHRANQREVIGSEAHVAVDRRQQVIAGFIGEEPRAA